MSVKLSLLVFFGLAGALNYFVTKQFISYAKWKQITDIPTERSSHTVTTPGGGGVGLAVTTRALLCSFLMFRQSQSADGSGWMLIIARMISSVLGLFDDRGGLSKKVCFLVQFLAGLIILIFVHGMDWFYIPFIIDLNFGLLGIPLGLIWIVGVTNIYNFLDGVNGIATLQGMVAALAWSLFGWLINEQLLVVSNVILCGTLLAFLYYNWTPAKVFMGDAGSVFLGLWFAGMPFWAVSLQQGMKIGPMIWFAAILLWPFLFDGSYTIFKRYQNGENVLDAHRSHLYQRLHIAGWTHEKVSSLYGLFATVCALTGFLFLYSSEVARLAIFIILFSVSLLFSSYVRRVEQKQQITQ